MNIPTIDGYAGFYDTAAYLARGGAPDTGGILNNILSGLTAEMRDFSGKAAVILILALLSSTAGTLNSALGESSAGRAAFFGFFAAVSALALACFNTALSYGMGVITAMTDFMDKFTPVLVMLIFACCKPASAAVFEPVLSAAVYVVSVITHECMVPLTTFSAVLSVAGNIGDKTSISGFIKIVNSTNKWLMTFVITLFTGINAVYGFSVSSLDAVSAKTIKFAVGSLVPVVGGFLSDSVDTVMTSASLIKNSAGAAGIIIICGICLAPALKLGAMQLMLRLCAALAEPVADARISGMLWGMSEAVTAVFGTVILTAVIFAVNICIILRLTT
ncbi:MAG: stage III sporulation protein AE [Clostridia bacterium]|nr:stage III sporulation protein AE [Clostridia bacterium]